MNNLMDPKSGDYSSEIVDIECAQWVAELFGDVDVVTEVDDCTDDYSTQSLSQLSPIPWRPPNSLQAAFTYNVHDDELFENLLPLPSGSPPRFDEQYSAIFDKRNESPPINQCSRMYSTKVSGCYRHSHTIDWQGNVTPETPISRNPTEQKHYNVSSVSSHPHDFHIPYRRNAFSSANNFHDARASPRFEHPISNSDPWGRCPYHPYQAKNNNSSNLSSSPMTQVANTALPAIVPRPLKASGTRNLPNSAERSNEPAGNQVDNSDNSESPRSVAAAKYIDYRLRELMSLASDPQYRTFPSPLYTLPPSHPFIREPTSNDVVLGRGCGINAFEGNQKFRRLIQTQQARYRMASRKEKPKFARCLVEFIRIEMGGRFLKKDPIYGLYFEVGDAKAEIKTGQALRESFCGLLDKNAARRADTFDDGSAECSRKTKKNG